MTKTRKPLPNGFIDPLDTERKWKPMGVKDIFGSAGDVFGKKRTKAEKEEEPETDEGTEEGEGDAEDDE